MSLPLPTRRVYPLDFMDKSFLVAMNHERGCNGAVVWELEVTGSIDPAHCRQAMRDLVTRYPICRSTVRPLDPRPHKETASLHYVVHEEYDLDDLFTYADLEGQGSEALARLRHEVRDRLVDPCVRFPLHLTLARVSPDACSLLFYQHHCTADARAVYGLLADFAVFVRCAEEGRRPAPEQLEPYPKLDEFAPLGISRLRGFFWGLQGLALTLARVFENQWRPIEPSLHNERRDYSGGNRTVHRVLDAKVLDEWKPLRARHGIGLAAMLSAAQFEADRRWNREMGRKTGKTVGMLAAETRPRDGSFRSFANHLAMLVMRLDLRGEPDLLETMLSLNRQLQHQVRTNQHHKRLLFERALTRGLPMSFMRQMSHETERAAQNHSFSSVIALDLPPLEGHGWRAEELWVTSPTVPPVGVLLTAVRYNGRVRFNYNYKETVVPREAVERLADHFLDALEDMKRALAREPEGERA